jgi:hypothetical protein
VTAQIEQLRAQHEHLRARIADYRSELTGSR